MRKENWIRFQRQSSLRKSTQIRPCLLYTSYVFFVYLFDKVGQATRLAPGADISEKILNITQGFSEAFSNACLLYTSRVFFVKMQVKTIAFLLSNGML